MTHIPSRDAGSNPCLLFQDAAPAPITIIAAIYLCCKEVPAHDCKRGLYVLQARLHGLTSTERIRQSCLDAFLHCNVWEFPRYDNALLNVAYQAGPLD